MCGCFSGGEDLGEMQGADASLLAMERAVDLHQAAVVGCGADFGAGVKHGSDFFG
jgi:hypothetical protein